MDFCSDTFGAVVDIGPGSPTGVCFGYGAKFPAKYQNAFFACDWSYGKLYAVHLPHGSTYRASFEEFASSRPFPITDLLVNPADGAMIAYGGRRVQSGLYRILCWGESTAPAKPVENERKTRRSLEAYLQEQKLQVPLRSISFGNLLGQMIAEFGMLPGWPLRNSR